MKELEYTIENCHIISLSQDKKEADISTLLHGKITLPLPPDPPLSAADSDKMFDIEIRFVPKLK